MADESLSAKRSAAGRAGAAKRWGARNSVGGGDDDLVCGTASELREMAEALDDNDTRTLTRARNVSNARVTAFRAQRPRVPTAKLAGKVFCEALPEPRPEQRLRLVNVNDDYAELWIYDYIDSWGGQWGVSASEVVEQLAFIDAPRIDVHINSPGGEVHEGLAIKQNLTAHRAEINVCIDSLAASIASVIAMAGDTIGIAESGTMMIHDASGFCYSTASDMRTMADLLDLMSNIIAGTYATRTGKGDTTTWREAMLATTWYDAPKAIKAGLADHILGHDPETAVASEAPSDAPASLLSALVASATPQPEPPAALSFLRAVKEATHR